MNEQFNHVTMLSAITSAAHLHHSHEHHGTWHIIPMMINELQFELHKTAWREFRTGFWLKHLMERSIRRPRHRRGIATWIFKKIGWEGADWIHLTQDMDKVGSCEHHNEPSGSIKCGNFLE
jgi:hypothetical protein